MRVDDETLLCFVVQLTLQVCVSQVEFAELHSPCSLTKSSSVRGIGCRCTCRHGLTVAL